MLSAFPQGGLIRKLWIEEVAEFSQHLLRLDLTVGATSAAAVSDEFLVIMQKLLSRSIPSCMPSISIERCVRRLN